MIEWIIFYDDGTEFTSADGGPEDAPREGALCIAIRDAEEGRVIRWGQDAYCWEDDTWTPHDREQCERYRRLCKWPIWVAGYWRNNALFWAAYQKALNDPRLPVKTGRQSREQDQPRG